MTTTETHCWLHPKRIAIYGRMCRSCMEIASGLAEEEIEALAMFPFAVLHPRPLNASRRTRFVISSILISGFWLMCFGLWLINR